MSNHDLVKAFRSAGEERAIDLATMLSILDNDSRRRIVEGARFKMQMVAMGMDTASPMDEMAFAVIAYMGWDKPEAQS